jgi:hypothetical protein
MTRRLSRRNPDHREAVYALGCLALLLSLGAVAWGVWQVVRLAWGRLP